MKKTSLSEILQDLYGPAIREQLRKEARFLRALDPRTDEEIETARKAYGVRMIQEAMEYDKLVQQASGLTKQILLLHTRDKYGKCTECEDGTNWPCRTVDLSLKRGEK